MDDGHGRVLVHETAQSQRISPVILSVRDDREAAQGGIGERGERSALLIDVGLDAVESFDPLQQLVVVGEPIFANHDRVDLAVVLLLLRALVALDLFEQGREQRVSEPGTKPTGWLADLEIGGNVPRCCPSASAARLCASHARLS